MSSVPKDNDKISTKKRLTRYQRLIEKGNEPAFPVIGEAFYLVDIWRDMGRVETGGMGPTQLSWSEMEAWQRTTGDSRQPWELRIIRSMSSAYIAQHHDAQEHDCPAPYSGSENVDRRSVESKLERMFGSYTSPPAGHK